MAVKRNRRYKRRSSPNIVMIVGVFVLAAALLVGAFFLIKGLFFSKSQEEVVDEPTTVVEQEEGTTITPVGFSASEGWFLYNERAYFGTAEGQVYAGEHTVDGVKYTFHDEGYLLDGWMQTGNLRYHFADGVMSKGTTELDGKVYHINSDGSMFVGWYNAANGYKLYYDLETGDLFTGWHEIDGKHYCFDSNGFLYTDTTADGVTVDATGAANEAEYQMLIGGNTVNTTAASGSTSVSATSPFTPQTTAGNGTVDMTVLNQKLDAILQKYGRSPKNIYDYVHDHYTYKHAKEGTIEQNALYLIENGTGSCYHFASLTYMLFVRAGYDTRYVSGLGWQNHTYHCWIMANFDGGWYFVDSLYVRSAKLTAADLKRIGYEWDESAYPS